MHLDCGYTGSFLIKWHTRGRAVTAVAIFVHGKMEAKRKALLALHFTGESRVIKKQMVSHIEYDGLLSIRRAKG